MMLKVPSKHVSLLAQGKWQISIFNPSKCHKHKKGYSHVGDLQLVTILQGWRQN